MMNIAINRTIKKIGFALCCTLLSMNTLSAEVKIISSQDLPRFSAEQEVQMLTVELQGGESSPPHRHNAHVFVYVLSGSVIMQVEKGEAVTLEPGETFYESPDDIHIQSANASNTQAAKFVVFMVKPKGTPTTLPVN